MKKLRLLSVLMLVVAFGVSATGATYACGMGDKPPVEGGGGESGE